VICPSGKITAWFDVQNDGVTLPRERAGNSIRATQFHQGDNVGLDVVRDFWAKRTFRRLWRSTKIADAQLEGRGRG
jgi:hypothetical protein